MMKSAFRCVQIVLLLFGVFAGDAVKSVSVTEGESVTLVIDVNTDDQIQWRFGHNNKKILIAQINRQSGKRTFYKDVLDGRFRGRLKPDHQTGSLIITDTRTTDSGLYEVIGRSTQTPLNTFNLTVYARLSVPVISHSSQNSSSSEQSCSLLCSAVNVSDVSVSWYRGHSLLSSISVSDLSISLSLPLEIKCLDDSYSCVLNNSISNQTTHLNTQLCKPCPGVFAGDAVKSVSVTEGESVTLVIDDTTDNEIRWRFGHNNILIAQINRQSGKRTFYKDALDGRFRDRLELDQTGSLIITDTRTTDSGLYHLEIISSTQTPRNTFNLTVYARLSVPVISHSSQNSSSSEQSCSLLCSAVNVSDVSVSWYRGHSLLSSISVSDPSISLSLPLEIECLDDSYSCVLNNSISNQTTHLNTQLCKPCADDSVSMIVLISSSAAAGSLLCVAVIGIFCICRKHRETDQEGS